MIASRQGILDRAIDGHMPAALTAPPDESRQWPLRFLANDEETGGVWVEPLNGSGRLLDPLIASGSAVQAAICIDRSRFAFNTSILRRNKHFWLTESTVVEAVLLRGPIELFTADRRSHPRYLVADASHIFAQITPAGALSPLQVRPWDASEGGISFLCPRDPTALRLTRDDTIELTISYRGRTLAARGSIRFTRFLTDRIIKTGVRLDAASISEPSDQTFRHLLTDATRLARPLVRI